METQKSKTNQAEQVRDRWNTVHQHCGLRRGAEERLHELWVTRLRKGGVPPLHLGPSTVLQPEVSRYHVARPHSGSTPAFSLVDLNLGVVPQFDIDDVMHIHNAFRSANDVQVVQENKESLCWQQTADDCFQSAVGPIEHNAGMRRSPYSRPSPWAMSWVVPLASSHKNDERPP